MNFKDTLKLLGTAIIGGLIAVTIITTTTTKDFTGIEATNANQIIHDDMGIYPLATSSKSSRAMQLDFRKASKNSLDGVVHILTEFTQKSSVYDNYFSLEDFFGNGSSRTYRATGSGVILSSDGYIVTNNHVVQQADKVVVTLNDKRSYIARIIGTDPTTDLALLKIEEKELPYLKFTDSDSVEIGDWVLAVGNPFNLNSTVTAGIVSAKARNINILGSNTAIESFIQTDAVVNRGNSGGALVDINGNIVGINAAIASGTGYYTGYSFAIPSSIVTKVVKDLKEFGIIQRAYLGITMTEINSEIAKNLKLDEIKGVYVENIVVGGSADKAGLMPGDVITKVNNVSINTRSELLEKIGIHRPGDKITITAERDNNEKKFDIILTNMNGNTELTKKYEGDIHTKLGATFKTLHTKHLKKLGISNGVQVVSLNQGLLKSAGIKEGFIIISIDQKVVNKPEDIVSILKNKKGGILIEGIYPNGVVAYYGLGL